MKRISLLFTLAALATLVAAAPAAGQGAADLYKSKTCIACHGADGHGDTVMGKKLGAHDFHAPEVQGKSDQELVEVTKNGKNKMPAYKDKLTDDQIKELVKYVKDMGKK
ncbi:MAG: cytochrome c [Acidobacteria bacterium]|nr:cytochrome c [Acidobacteriota bacterium]